MVMVMLLLMFRDDDNMMNVMTVLLVYNSYATAVYDDTEYG